MHTGTPPGHRLVREAGSPHICHISMYCRRAERLSSRAVSVHGHVAPIGHVIESYGIGYHQFSNDTQLFFAVDTADSADLTCVTGCSDAVRLWFLESDLLLNGDKSESVVIGTAAQLKSATTAFTSVTCAGSSLTMHFSVFKTFLPVR